MSAPAREIHLLRFVPGDSHLHRMWAGTKLLAVVAIDIALVARPGWPAQALVWALVLVAFLTSGVSPTALPRPPRWFVLLVGLDCLLSIGSGGAPVVHLAGISVELGGMLEWWRITSLALLVLGMATLVAWTTPMAELTPAMSKLATPLPLLVLAPATPATSVPWLTYWLLGAVVPAEGSLSLFVKSQPRQLST